MVRRTAARNNYVGILVKRKQRTDRVQPDARTTDRFFTAAGLTVNLVKCLSGSVFHVCARAGADRIRESEP